MIQKNKKVELSDEEIIAEKAMLRHIRDEARKEKVFSFVVKYKKPILISVIILILVLIGSTINASYQENKDKKYSKLLHQFLVHAEARQNDQAIKILEDIKNDKAAPADLKALASIKYASILLDQNKFSEATELFLKVNEDRRVDIYLKEFAGLLALKTMIDSDEPAFVEKIEKLLPKLEKETVILKSPILEQKGIFYWLQNKPKEARKIFEELALDPKTPDDLKIRVKDFIRIIDNKEK